MQRILLEWIDPNIRNLDYQIPPPGILTHAPRKGRDESDFSVQNYILSFQLTHPTQDATWVFASISPLPSISIHTSLAGRDIHRRGLWLGTLDFNSHAPRGARLYILTETVTMSQYLENAR